MSISRAVSVVVVLPAILAAFDKFSKRKSQPVAPEATSHEHTPLLLDNQDAEGADQAHEQELVEPKIEEASIVRELVMVRVALVINAVGMLFLWHSRSALEVNIGKTRFDL